MLPARIAVSSASLDIALTCPAPSVRALLLRIPFTGNHVSLAWVSMFRYSPTVSFVEVWIVRINGFASWISRSSLISVSNTANPICLRCSSVTILDTRHTIFEPVPPRPTNNVGAIIFSSSSLSILSLLFFTFYLVYSCMCNPAWKPLYMCWAKFCNALYNFQELTFR